MRMATAVALLLVGNAVAAQDGEVYRCPRPDGAAIFVTAADRPQACESAASWQTVKDAAQIPDTAIPSPRRSTVQATRISPRAFDGEITRQSQLWNVPEHLVRAVIHAESTFNPLAISPKGAMGLMQLMPATAKRFGVVQALDPAQNIAGGVRYLSWLLARYRGDWQKAVAGYNAGEGAVDRYGGVPPYRETRDYVAKVWRLSQSYGLSKGR